MKLAKLHLLFFFLGSTLGAQTPPPYPGGAPLSRAPDFSSWKISCQPLAGSSTGAAAPASADSAAAPAASASSTPAPYVSMTVVKTKDRRKVETLDAQGGKTTRFYLGSMEAFNPPGALIPRYYEGQNSRSGDAYIDFSLTDFPECSWVTAAMYTGVMQVNGHPCLVFMKKNPNALAALDPSVAGGASGMAAMDTAYIDAQTRLPVKNQVDGLVYVYEFLAPPSGLLPVPKLVQAKLDFEQKRDRELSARPAP